VNGSGDTIYERRKAMRKNIKMVTNQQVAMHGWNKRFFQFFLAPIFD
jgi:hypothetical protein